LIKLLTVKMNITKLNQYREDSYKKHVHHSKACSHTKLINNCFSLINIVIVTFTGIANNITVVSGHSPLYGIMLSILLYISLLVSGIQKYLKFDELSTAHSSSSLGYSLLYKNIRDSPDEITDYLINHFHLLEATEPPIPDFIKNSDVDIPEGITPEVKNSSEEDEDAINYELDKLKEDSF
jgi:hypothetical protein